MYIIHTYNFFFFPLTFIFVLFRTLSRSRRHVCNCSLRKPFTHQYLNDYLCIIAATLSSSTMTLDENEISLAFAALPTNRPSFRKNSFYCWFICTINLERFFRKRNANGLESERLSQNQKQIIRVSALVFFCFLLLFFGSTDYVKQTLITFEGCSRSDRPPVGWFVNRPNHPNSHSTGGKKKKKETSHVSIRNY